MPQLLVYKHTAPSGKAYVGFTAIGVAARWGRHVKAARNGSPLPFHRAIRKYGADTFTHEVLERMTTEAGAKRAEHSDATRSRMSEAPRARWTARKGGV